MIINIIQCKQIKYSFKYCIQLHNFFNYTGDKLIIQINVLHEVCTEFYRDFLYRARFFQWFWRRNIKANQFSFLHLPHSSFPIYFHYTQTKKWVIIYCFVIYNWVKKCQKSRRYHMDYLQYLYTDSITRCRWRNAASRTIVLIIYRSSITIVIVTQLTRSHSDAHFHFRNQASRPFSQLLLPLVVVLCLQSILHQYKCPRLYSSRNIRLIENSLMLCK